MSKELEAIRDDKLRIGLLGLKRLFEVNAKKMTKDEIMAFDFTFMNITKALLELQAIKESKPSEALECLDRIKAITKVYSIDLFSEFAEDLDTIKQALIKSQEMEKALEIIFKKTVGIFQLKCCKNVNEYNDLKFSEFEKLTEEEFILLKRWCDEKKD